MCDSRPYDELCCRLQDERTAARAWPEFLEFHRAVVQNYASTEPYIQAADVEDIAQEVLVRLFKSFRATPHRLLGEFQIRKWLKTTTTRLCFDMGRKQGRTVIVDLDSARDQPDPASQRLEEGSEAIERRLDLEHCLAELPRKERAVYFLRTKDLEFDEIAQRLAIPRSTANIHHKRALERLRTCLIGRGWQWAEKEALRNE